MFYERILEIGEKARGRGALTAEEKKFVAEVIPRELVAFPRIKFPSRLKHPAGFTVSGAVVRTFVRCALLISARRVLGSRYGAKSEFYDRVERDLVTGIALSNFKHEAPKGTYCCARCTLAVLPVLEAGAIRWFDCKPLARSVRGIIENRQWRFKKPSHPRMVQWSLGA